MVGLDAVMLEIMEKLINVEPNLQVIPIVGMGGIGKTFFAQNIYATPSIKEHFDICAWATVSQQYIAGEILCEVLSQATNKEKERLSGRRGDEFGPELYRYLFGRRFLIVLDDMWSIEAWNKVQRFFPNNRKGSRVLVTTRLLRLSSELNNASYYRHHMSFLDKASSWNLFLKTVFGSTSCPRELKEVGKKIVRKCRGLPLSLAVVGGLLKKVDSTRASWESILNDLSSLVNLDKDKHSLKLLKMSYNHLPVYLKPCFLYMGVFEEDSEICVSTLVKLWVSEGFIKPTNGEALETTARGFLQDLMDRNLILIHKLGSTGSVKYCKIHDSLRDMCMKEGHKDGFYHVMRKCDPPLQGIINTQRRVIVPWNTSNEKVHKELKSMSRARSIICEYGTKVLPFRNMRLLKTLHECHDKSSYINPLAFNHVNLRHLTIKATSMSSFLLPSVVSHIWNLHTLKVYCVDEPTILFSDFWKMPQFRYVKFVHYSFHLPDPPSHGNEVIMKNLHTLKGVSDFKCCEGVVNRIPKLSLKYSNDHQGEYFAGNIKSV